MKVGSLFSGIGGFDLGLERAGMEIRWQVEIDDYCNKVLAKHWPKVKRYGDIKTLEPRELEPVDLICGGFPCQPFSLAGKRRGKEDNRYLWPEMRRIIEGVRPAWVVGENVPGIVRMELDTVLSDLEALGYSTTTFIIPACAVNAPHRRSRAWIIAHANSAGGRLQSIRAEPEGTPNPHNISEERIVADAEKSRSREISIQQRGSLEADIDTDRSNWWAAESGICGVAYGIPHRMDRLRGLGNAVVPQIVEFIGRKIMGIWSDGR